MMTIKLRTFPLKKESSLAEPIDNTLRIYFNYHISNTEKLTNPFCTTIWD